MYIQKLKAVGVQYKQVERSVDSYMIMNLQVHGISQLEDIGHIDANPCQTLRRASNTVQSKTDDYRNIFGEV